MHLIMQEKTFALYEALLKLAPSAGALVAQCALVGQLKGPEIGLLALKECEQQLHLRFKPLWAAYVDLYTKNNNTEDAQRCYNTALSLITELPLINFRKAKMNELNQGERHPTRYPDSNS